MLIGKNKKGTIILSHYRSGGTQMKLIVQTLLDSRDIPNIDCGEINVDVSKSDLLKQIGSQFYNDDSTYKVVLLNNPFVIAYLDSINYFKKLNKDFKIISVERKDKLRCLLSLPLWEMFIQDGLYDNSKHWTEKNMQKFHNRYIKDPIPTRHIGLGYDMRIQGNISPEYYLNTILRTFISDIALNQNITKKYNYLQIYYEDYENNMNSFIKKYIDNPSKKQISLLKDTRQKIPYISQDYSVYFENIVKKTLENWNI